MSCLPYIESKFISGPCTQGLDSSVTICVGHTCNVTLFMCFTVDKVGSDGEEPFNQVPFWAFHQSVPAG